MIEFRKNILGMFNLKRLVIVESPTKAKTIKGFLGKDYEVIASKGHLRDLPKTTFGIKIEDNLFIPQYRVSKDKQPTLKEIKALAKKSDTIYIATDEDREGEAIGYHTAYALGLEPFELPRIVFHEITKKAILHSIENPTLLDRDKIDAQQTRRLLDRIVGYKLSPLLSNKIQRGLSAGRVQSAALKIIVIRDREIEEFKPIQYFKVFKILKGCEFNLFEFRDKKLKKLDIDRKEFVEEILKKLSDEEFTVEKIEKRETTTKTSAPFMTSTLQQSASNSFGYSSKKTMMIAQSLYEGIKMGKEQTGLITYMRTDSLNVSKEAVEACRDYIRDNFEPAYLPKSAKAYKSKAKNSQEAHEAIRPTRVDLTPERVREYLKDDEYKIYSLIYNRFVASQMSDAKFESLSIIISSESSKFKTTGRKLKFDGFYKIYGELDKDKLLPEFEEASSIEFRDIQHSEHFTEPPARFNEASLIKTLESLGIGRPSTYSPTISILQTRGYIEAKNRQLISTDIARNVMSVLEEHFSDIVDSTFTASLEQKLDDIADGNSDWQKVLLEFYEPFIKKIEDGKENIKSQKIAIPTGEKCPECGEDLVRRKGRFGEFIACSTYPKCKYTQSLEEIETSDEKCDKCDSDMVVKRGKRGSFLACKNYPDCKNTKSLNGGAPAKKETIDVKCPECNSELLKRFSRRGPFYGCSNYPKCTFTSKHEPSEDKCPECGYMVIHRELKTKSVTQCLKCDYKLEIKKDAKN
jgi:DNA topoisomerase-1